MTTLRVALIGYGNAGRIFHAPLISGVPGLELAVVSSSKPQAVLADWPQVRVVATPQEAFASPDVDLVVIATGNESHFPLAEQALHAGKHVVVDKPCTVTLAQTEALLALARSAGKVLTVFQNRRWDADFLSLRQVLASKSEEKGVPEDDLRPDDWLDDFYANRKGSGKRPAQPAATGRSAAGT